MKKKSAPVNSDPSIRLSYPHQGSGFSDISQTDSDITIFVKQFKKRVQNQVDLDNAGNPFILFDEIKTIKRDEELWLLDNHVRFFKETPNERLVAESYLSELGYICSIEYSLDGNYIITGHSTGLIQVSIYLFICFVLILVAFITYLVLATLLEQIDCYRCKYALLIRYHDFYFHLLSRYLSTCLLCRLIEEIRTNIK